MTPEELFSALASLAASEDPNQALNDLSGYVVALKANPEEWAIKLKKAKVVSGEITDIMKTLPDTFEELDRLDPHTQ